MVRVALLTAKLAMNAAHLLGVFVFLGGAITSGLATILLRGHDDLQRNEVMARGPGVPAVGRQFSVSPPQKQAASKTSGTDGPPGPSGGGHLEGSPLPAASSQGCGVLRSPPSAGESDRHINRIPAPATPHRGRLHHEGIQVHGVGLVIGVKPACSKIALPEPAQKVRKRAATSGRFEVVVTAAG